jgi:transporter family-2 protein
VQGFGIVMIAVLVGLAAGCLLGAQPSVNGQLGLSLSHPLQAALISFATGTTILFVLCLAFGVFPPSFQRAPGELPWWIWFGGAIGVVMVTTSLIFVPRIGSLPWFAAVMTGQIVAALLLDHYGLMGNPKASASPLRLLGAGLMIASVLVVVYAKHSEVRNGTGHGEPESGQAATLGNDF